MTLLSEILDCIWRTERDRGGVAEAAAQAMSPLATAELLAFVANAHGRGWLRARALQPTQVILTVGPGGFHALASITRDDVGSTLIQLRDVGVGLATASQVIVEMWGAPIVTSSADLLQALQYVRDTIDTLLYRRDDRDDEIAQVSRQLHMNPDLLLALATADRQSLFSVNA